MIFKYEELRRYLRRAKETADVVSLADWTENRAIILRHDIDLEVEAAYRLAEIEVDEGVRSSFLFLTTCHSYNVNSRINRGMISKISDMGLDVGLHFDPTIYGSKYAEELEREVDKEADIIAQITGKVVVSVSLHNPSVHGLYPLFRNYRNAYQPDIFQNDLYISDSQMRFRGKDPWKFLEKAKLQTIQVLLHPLHYSENGGGYSGILGRFMRQFCSTIDESFRPNSKYSAELAEKSLVDKLFQQGEN